MKQTIEAPGFASLGAILGFGIAAFRVVVGADLAARLEFARGVANFLAGLSVIFGLFGLAGSFVGSLFVGPWGLLLVLLNTVDIISGAMRIYLIGETEKRGPNS